MSELQKIKKALEASLVITKCNALADKNIQVSPEWCADRLKEIESALTLLDEMEKEGEWQKTPPPKDKDFYMRCEHIMPCRWKTYKPQARKQGYPEGRWQVMNEYGGWDNYDGEIDEWKDEITC